MKPMWVLFTNRPAHDGYVSPERAGYDQRDRNFSAQAEFETEAQARAALADYLRCDSAERGEYCYSHNPTA